LFHMTDLPFGRGGSPLQNLIVRGLRNTRISAIHVQKGLDAGDIYLKKDLSLDGTAHEIFIRASKIIKEMIMEIIENDLCPIPQQGEPEFFKRRAQEDGNVVLLTSIGEIYDYIRMLDCEGYPPAFLETDNVKFEFSHAVIKDSKTIEAHVKIIQK